MPEAIENPLLISKMKKYYPIEIKLTYPDEPRDVSKQELLSYGLYFDQQMPRLAQIIGVDWIGKANTMASGMSLIHISEPTRLLSISYAVFCLKQNKTHN